MADGSIPQLHASASRRRTLYSLRAARRKGELAILLGAGADIGLYGDAKQKAVSWAGLMNSLADEVGAQRDQGINEKWPTEMAAVYRGFLGDVRYRSRISSATTLPYTPNLDEEFTFALAELLASSNVVVTTNYSTSAEELLASYFRRTNARRKQIICLDREDLPSFQFPRPQRNPRRIYVIHLHGRASPLSEPVLDAWGYNIVQNEDPEYRSLLRNLFEQRFVVSVGVSWQDVPLRNEAAYVKRTRGFAAVQHLMLRFHGDPNELLEYTPPRQLSFWSKAMTSSYNVTVQPATQESLPRYISQITKDLPSPPKSVSELSEFFEDTGDFESSEQHRIFGSSADSRNRCLSDFCDTCAEFAASSGEAWERLATVEKHLRHHLYLYGGTLPARAVDGRTMSVREWLSCLVYKKAADNYRSVPPAVAFDLLIGAAETWPGKNVIFEGRRPGDDLNWDTLLHRYSPLLEKLSADVRCDPMFAARLRYVPWVVSGRPKGTSRERLKGYQL